jgi:hypothetical protein
MKVRIIKAVCWNWTRAGLVAVAVVAVLAAWLEFWAWLHLP